ncbi:MAG: polysaccharide biosynthesis protein [Clostridia bacterium]|nr:polysaccharide biosynthesis protein [Clostridia bacterium]
MKRSKAIFYNLILMTAVTLVMRFVSVVFNVYVTGRIGAGGIGLYSLIMSVGGFAITFATSGVNFASTRMTAEAVGRGHSEDISRVMRRCICYALCFGCTAMLLLYILAKPISVYLLCDTRCVVPLRLLSAALPFISLSSALSGYFTAVRRVYKSALVQLGEQLVTISVTVKLLGMLLPKGTAYACAALIGGTVISEASAFIISYILYKADLKKHIKKGSGCEKNLTKKLLSISLPIAFSAYVRSALVSVEHMLIPRGLRKFGSSSDSALASYGILHGMVMPIILFPMAIMSSFAGLLVPEVAQSLAAQENKRVDAIVERVFQIALCFGIGVSGVMICFSSELGHMIYNSAEAGLFIKVMAPLIPVMYLDHVIDGVLKGMGEQLYSMRVNIFDAFMSVVLVYFLVPVWGVYGYVVVIFVMEIINASLSAMRLFKRCNSKLKIVKWVIKPLCSVLAATYAVKLILSFDAVLSLHSTVIGVLGITLAVLVYCGFLLLTRAVTYEDVKWFKCAIK